MRMYCSAGGELLSFLSTTLGYARDELELVVKVTETAKSEFSGSDGVIQRYLCTKFSFVSAMSNGALDFL